MGDLEVVEVRPENSRGVVAGRKSIVILGAGHAGTAAAYRAAMRGLPVTVLEGRDIVGGVGGSFDFEGVRCDYGSHRLNTACPQRVYEDLEKLLGDDLLVRPKSSRLRLHGRWIRLPMQRSELVRLPPSLVRDLTMDALGSAFAEVTSRLRPPNDAAHEATFPEILESDLGKTLARSFYLPYARKVWGVPPEQLSVPRHQRRRASSMFRTLLRNGAFVMLGRQAVGKHQDKFLYSRRGYGQIPERYHEEATRAGAKFVLGARVTAVETANGRVSAVRLERGGEQHRLEAEAVWSTIPLTQLARIIQPNPPGNVLDASSRLSTRAMILIYIVLQQPQFTTYDTHFIPDPDIPVTRLSEPKNYSGAIEPRDRTVLCAELPCDADSDEFKMSDEELGHSLVQWLERADLPVRSRVLRAATRRLKVAYPVYRVGTDVVLEEVESWLRRTSNLVTLGLQGLFSHDDSHHVIDMAYSAVDCVDDDGRFDWEKWTSFRTLFDERMAQFLRSMNGIAL